MNAIELYHKDGKSASVFYCSKCRNVARTEAEAEQCCKPRNCDMCNKEIVEAYYTRCPACRKFMDDQREAERFAKAEKVTEWDGPVLCEGFGYDDGYFESVEDLYDVIEDDEFERPEYCWTCTETCFLQLDYGDIIEHASQEAYEDWDASSVNGKDELKAAIEKFNSVNTQHVVWNPNYKKTFILPKQLP